MRRIAGLALAFTLIAGSAEAADWSGIEGLTGWKKVEVQNGWNRFYIGANGGYGWAQGRADTTLGGVTVRTTEDMPGGIAGGQLGLNWQHEFAVFGFEADLQWSGQEQTSTICPPGICGRRVTLHTEIPWFGTVRGRWGVTADRVLIYATGGLAYGELKLNVTWPTFGRGTLTDDWIGWTVGGGVEVPFAGRWTAKVEYLYLDAPSVEQVTVSGAALVPLRLRVAGHNHIVRAGINYHF